MMAGNVVEKADPSNSMYGILQLKEKRRAWRQDFKTGFASWPPEINIPVVLRI